MMQTLKIMSGRVNSGLTETLSTQKNRGSCICPEIQDTVKSRQRKPFSQVVRVNETGKKPYRCFWHLAFTSYNKKNFITEDEKHRFLQHLHWKETIFHCMDYRVITRHSQDVEKKIMTGLPAGSIGYNILPCLQTMGPDLLAA